MLTLINKKLISCPVYSFEIWSFFKLRNRNHPRMVVDTSETFKTKLKAFLVHESQRLVIWLFIWKLMLKDSLSGIVNRTTYAEVFYRLK